MFFQIPGYPDLQFGSLYCIGRNYAKHAAEMNSDVPDNPVVFLKPRSSIIFTGENIVIPELTNDVHHEVELVVLIGQKVRNVTPDEAGSAIKAFGVGLDMTARDLQAEAKKAGLPWSLAKGFETFAPLGTLYPYTKDLDLQNLSIEVQVNAEVRQKGQTSDMIFSVNQIISYISTYFTLYPGDLIYTGTPEGVSAVKKGDQITATLGEDISTLQVHVV
ncbi:MAG: fumarylacetoacetate hydrolase family protein [Balneolaceae bacterium]|nr:MAG: fumarylacetoacetate hydrolase family protein [Balneolaceae bacterium]